MVAGAGWWGGRLVSEAFGAWERSGSDGVRDDRGDELTIESCGGALEWSSGSGLVRVERMSRKLALREFDKFALTAGFMEVGEEVLRSLLEDDELWTEGEERVFESVVLWMKGVEGGEVRGLELLRTVDGVGVSGGSVARGERRAGGACGAGGGGGST
jgi:hypothetical protein